MDYSYSCTSQEGHSQRRARRKRMIESGRGKKKNSNTYCHTRWTLCPLLEAGTILSVNRSRHQQPCSFSFSVSFSRLQETPQLRHTQRQRVADPRNETKRNERNYQRHSRLNSFSLRFHRNAYIVYISIYIEGSRNDSQINHTPEMIKTLTVNRRTKNTVASALQTF